MIRNYNGIDLFVLKNIYPSLISYRKMIQLNSECNYTGGTGSIIWLVFMAGSIIWLVALYGWFLDLLPDTLYIMYLVV